MYNDFKYEQSEWDNIATVIPRFLIYLEKYISGISSKCYEFNEREHVNHLRQDFQAQMIASSNSFSLFKLQDSNEKEVIDSAAKILSRKHANLKADFE